MYFNQNFASKNDEDKSNNQSQSKGEQPKCKN